MSIGVEWNNHVFISFNPLLHTEIGLSAITDQYKKTISDNQGWQKGGKYP